jgi:hypothetical protein
MEKAEGEISSITPTDERIYPQQKSLCTKAKGIHKIFGYDA